MFEFCSHVLHFVGGNSVMHCRQINSSIRGEQSNGTGVFHEVLFNEFKFRRGNRLVPGPYPTIQQLHATPSQVL